MPLYFAGVSATIAAQTHRYSCREFNTESVAFGASSTLFGE